MELKTIMSVGGLVVTGVGTAMTAVGKIIEGVELAQQANEVDKIETEEKTEE